MSEEHKTKILNFYAEDETLVMELESVSSELDLSLKHVPLSEKSIQNLENTIYDELPDILFIDRDSSLVNKELIQNIKSVPMNPAPVIIVVSKEDSYDHKKEAFEKGAQEYFVKNSDFKDFALKLKVIIQEREERLKLDEATRDLSLKNADLLEKNRKLEELSVTDDLTSLYNVRYMKRYLEGVFMLLQRYNRPFSVVMLDLDHFKDVNDKNDHLVGSRTLREVARVIEEHTRNTDVKIRYGGDEYVILMPETYVKSAEVVASRLREKISQLSVVLPSGSVLKITASIGISAYDSKRHKSYADILRDADVAMYSSKKNGRNRVEVFSSEVEGYDQEQSALIPLFEAEEGAHLEVSTDKPIPEPESKQSVTSKNIPASLYWYWVKLKKSIRQ